MDKLPYGLSRQFDVVYHSSYHSDPPHAWEGSKTPDNYDEYENTSPYHFHAGTRQSAEKVGKRDARAFIHTYLIDKSQIHPVTYGDSPETFHLSPNQLARGLKMHGVTQPELFESLRLTSGTLFDTADVIPYRNNAEDFGSISYAIPKDEVGPRRAARYLGVEGSTDDL